MSYLIKIPSPVKVLKFTPTEDGGLVRGEEEVTFPQFCIRICEQYKPFFSGPVQGRIYTKIEDIMNSVNGDETLTMDSKYYDPLREAAKTPGWPTVKVNAAYIRGGFYDAIEKAEEIDVPTDRAKLTKLPELPKPGDLK